MSRSCHQWLPAATAPHFAVLSYYDGDSWIEHVRHPRLPEHVELLHRSLPQPFTGRPIDCPDRSIAAVRSFPWCIRNGSSHRHSDPDKLVSAGRASRRAGPRGCHDHLNRTHGCPVGIQQIDPAQAWAGRTRLNTQVVVNTYPRTALPEKSGNDIKAIPGRLLILTGFFEVVDFLLRQHPCRGFGHGVITTTATKLSFQAYDTFFKAFNATQQFANIAPDLKFSHVEILHIAASAEILFSTIGRANMRALHPRQTSGCRCWIPPKVGLRHYLPS